MSFVRIILRDVEGYAPGEQPKVPGIIKLNTNENPYPPSPTVLEAMRSVSADTLRKYPDPLSVDLRRICAERYGYPDESWVFAGNGMDEALALAIRSFVDPGETILAGYPTYTLYEVLARLHGAVYRTIDLDESFQITDVFFAAEGKLCFITRPNAPSGVSTPRDVLERFCESFKGLVFIDEAYADFAEDSCLDFPNRFSNVLVGRTFSKSFSLAGMRLGTAVGHPDLIREFFKTKDSYNLNAFSQAAGIAAMNDYNHMLANVERVKATRLRVTLALRELGFRVPDSQSNFVLAQWDETPPAVELMEQLRARNILVRYFPVRRLENALRISVGTDEEMDALIAALGELVL